MTPQTDPTETVVYTDGACKGNPGPGGWGWVVPDGASGNGGEPLTTNQRMELTAVLEALRALDGRVVVISDSTYVVNCFRDGWWQGWIKRDWKNSKKEPVANRDLWEPLIEIYRARRDELEFRWVKGHAGDQWNERADELAVEAAEAQPREAAGSGASGASWLPTGHSLAAFGVQPPALGGYEDNPTSEVVKRRLGEVFDAKRQLHPDLVVLTGLRLGAETLAAIAARDVSVPFVAVLPFPDPDAKWPESSRRRFTDLLGAAESVVQLERSQPVDPRQAGQSLSRRNAWMARTADEAVVVWDRTDPWVGRLVADLEQKMPDDIWVIDI